VQHPGRILTLLGFRPKKRLSQNFLTTSHWADKLVDSVLEHPGADEIWEIGAGLGALTGPLLKKASVPVRIFEVDPRLASNLKREFQSADIIEGDFSKLDLSQYLESSTKISVLSNLPYHLSSNILFKLLEIRDQVVCLVLTFQKEFADRLKAKPRTKDFSSLTVMTQVFFDIEKIGILSPNCFHPKPEVSSQALKLIPKLRPEISMEELSSVVRTAFQHRRKKLVRNLEERFPRTKLDATFSELGFSQNTRAEELDPSNYVTLAQRLC